LLKIYSEQEKSTGSKSDMKQAGTLRNDPLKPFLQGWLADSPNRGKFFDEPARKPDVAVGYSGPGSGTPLDNGRAPVLNGIDLGGSGLKTERGPVAAQPNPYLQGLDMSVLQDANPGRTFAPAAVPAFQPASTPASSGPVSSAPATIRPADKKPPQSALEDDKKYFPQLKKF